MCNKLKYRFYNIDAIKIRLSFYFHWPRKRQLNSTSNRNIKLAVTEFIKD